MEKNGSERIGKEIPHFIFAWGYFPCCQPVSSPHVNHNLLEFASSYVLSPLNVTLKMNIVTNLMLKVTQTPQYKTFVQGT